MGVVAVASALATYRRGWVVGLLLGCLPLSVSSWIALVLVDEGWVVIGGAFITFLAVVASGLGMATGLVMSDRRGGQAPRRR